MIQLSTRSRVIGVVATLMPLYYLSYVFSTSHNFPFSALSSGLPAVQIHPNKFQSLWLQTNLLDPQNLAPVREYCSQQKWHPNLIFDLPGSNGGIGNVRQHFLDFFFFAIEAGASSIILPGMALRVEQHLIDTTGAGHGNFTYMFDEAYFRSTMREACPQLHIYSPTDPVLELATRLPDRYQPIIPYSRRDIDHDAWVELTTSWLNDRKALNTTAPVIVSLDVTLWEVDTRNNLPLGFRREFSQHLRIRPDIRQFAAVAMSGLTSAPHNISLDPTDHIHPNAFYGAHLRTESDAVEAGFFSSDPSINPISAEYAANWTVQTDAYLTQATRYGLTTIFAASGNETDLERFRVKAAEYTPSIVVLTKWDLLPRYESQALAKLHWDQQALVDLEILKRCSVFGGYSKSSFSWYIAVTRTEYMEAQQDSGMTTIMDGWSATTWGDGTKSFDNGLNMLIGRRETIEIRAPLGLWP